MIYLRSDKECKLEGIQELTIEKYSETTYEVKVNNRCWKRGSSDQCKKIFEGIISCISKEYNMIDFDYIVESVINM